MNNLHHEIVMLLVQRKTSYANPMNSQQIGAALKVTPSYVRGQLAILVRKKLVEVRRGNGGGYYAGKGCGQKMMMNNMEQPLDKLGCTMEEMLEYLQLLEDGCKKIPAEFYTGKEIQAIESLLQIMEGLHGYQKLIKSAAVLLNIDASAALGEGENLSVSVILTAVPRIFGGICQAMENKDYSLLADLVEYDLMPLIQTAQTVLIAVQQRYAERIS